MSGFSMASYEGGSEQIVRAIARISQMLIELRDEYLDQQREDSLDQIERRIQELQDLATQLHDSRNRESVTE